MAEAGKNPVGRPTSRDEETERKILHALRIGMSRRRAAHYARIAESTFFAWVKDEVEFSERCLAAEAEGIAHHAEKIHGAVDLPKETAAATIQAARFYLSTHDRENFAEKVAVEHSGTLTIADLVSRVGSAELTP